MKRALVSIVIPTKNAGSRFNTILTQVFSQNYKNFEVIVIDSSSIDNTFEIAKQYPTKIIKIKPEDFGHGKTRNLGAKLAKGKYIVYLTQDAVPKNKNWLSNLINNFSDNLVVGVYGRQIPYKNTNILESFSYLRDYPNSKRIWFNNNFGQEDLIFSDVNSAIRKDILKKEGFSKKIIVSEDHEWAYRILGKGYKIVYDPDAAVIHSHNHSLIEVFKRFFDMGASCQYIYDNYKVQTLLKKGIKRYLIKLNYVIEKGHFFLVFYAILFDIIKFLGMNLGKNEKFLPIFIKKRFSNYKSYWNKEVANETKQK